MKRVLRLRSASTVAGAVAYRGTHLNNRLSAVCFNFKARDSTAANNVSPADVPVVLTNIVRTGLTVGA